MILRILVLLFVAHASCQSIDNNPVTSLNSSENPPTIVALNDLTTQTPQSTTLKTQSELTTIKNAQINSTTEVPQILEPQVTKKTINSLSENIPSESPSTTPQPNPSDIIMPDIIDQFIDDLRTNVPFWCFLMTILILMLTNIVTLIACCCCIKRGKRRMSHSLVDNKFGHSLYDVSSNRARPPPPQRPPRRENSTLIHNQPMTFDRLRELNGERESIIYENTRYF